MWRLNTDDYSAQIILNYHSGPINDMAVSDAYNMALTCGNDGTIKLWDYCREQEYYSQKFDGKALCIDLMRRSEINRGRVAVCGFDTGVVRVLQITDSNIEIGHAMKAHDGPVVFAKYSPDQLALVTASSNGEIFFFDVNGHLDLGKCIPICLL
jgi:WD40 repeat protein